MGSKRNGERGSQGDSRVVFSSTLNLHLYEHLYNTHTYIHTYARAPAHIVHVHTHIYERYTTHIYTRTRIYLLVNLLKNLFSSKDFFTYCVHRRGSKKNTRWHSQAKPNNNTVIIVVHILNRTLEYSRCYISKQVNEERQEREPEGEEEEREREKE